MSYEFMHTPWRKEFTGPPCRCGIPTPLTEEEKKIDKEKLAEEKGKFKTEHRQQLQEYKERRLADINRRMGY